MISNFKGFLLTIAIGVTITTGGILADEPTKTDVASSVAVLSDSTLATFAKALAESDTTLLVSIFPQPIQIAMPEGKTVIGRAKVAKYTPLLLENFGGCEMTSDRQAIELMLNHDDVVRDMGTVKLIRRVDDQVHTAWSGAYTIYWRLADSAWTMERIFVGQVKR